MGSFYKQEEVESRLTFSEGWSFEDNSIHKEFKFRDFSAAFAFMTTVAIEAERANHHPDWSNTWNTVKISLSTHSEGGVTDKDLQLAERIDKQSSLFKP